MAAYVPNPTIRATTWGGAASNTSDLLNNYITDELRNLEPNLEFSKFGVKRDVPKGYDRLFFPRVVQISTSSVSSLSEGVNPTTYVWAATGYGASLTQYGLVVEISDLLVHNSAIETVDSCLREVKYALARELDNYIQGVVNAGTYGVKYAGGRTTRATLGAGDILDTTLYTKGISLLRGVNSAGLKPMANGYYAAIMHTNSEYDLMSNTNAGSWIDTARYYSPEDIKKGTVPAFRGAMIYTSPNVQKFASTVDVYPTTIIGRESFGWGFIQPITPIMVTTPDSANPLLVYTSIGGKFAVAATLFEDTSTVYRVVRLEAATSLS